MLQANPSTQENNLLGFRQDFSPEEDFAHLCDLLIKNISEKTQIKLFSGSEHLPAFPNSISLQLRKFDRSGQKKISPIQLNNSRCNQGEFDELSAVRPTEIASSLITRLHFYLPSFKLISFAAMFFSSFQFNGPRRST